MAERIDVDLIPTSHSRWSWVDGVCLALSALVLIAFRLHAFGLPLETDECNYVYIASRLLEGDRLYVDVWDHQPFGVFAFLAGVIALFGDAPVVFRWTATASCLASLGLVYAISRRCAGRTAAVFAAVLFAFVSSDPGTAGEGCNREIYMNACLLAAWYLALRWGESGNRWALSGSGCALGIGSAIKTIVAIHWVLLAVWVVVVAWRRHAAKGSMREAIVALVLFGCGPALLWLATSAYFAATDRFSQFVDAVFLFNLSYSAGSEHFWTRFVTFFAPPRHPFIFDSALPLWIGSLVVGAWLFVEVIRRPSREIIALLLLGAGGYLTVCLPAQFWPHYYYLLIPAAVVLVSVGVVRCAPQVARLLGRSGASSSKVSVALLVLFSMAVLAVQSTNYLLQPLFGLTVHRYNSRDFWGRAQGENVRQVTDPEDEIFVFGSDAAIYYYARRRCASRYTMITGIHAGYAGVEARRQTLLEELRRRKPRLIVVLFDEPPFPEWTAFLREHYGEPVGWDFRDIRPGSTSDGPRDPIMFVVVRKDRPIPAIDWDWDRSQVGGWHLGDPH